MEQIKNWIAENPTLYSVFKYILLVGSVLLLIQLIRRFLRKKVSDTSARYKSQKGVEIIGYIILIILSISYFTGSVKDFTLAIGLFSAGVAITLQELFLSIASLFSLGMMLPSHVCIKRCIDTLFGNNCNKEYFSSKFRTSSNLVITGRFTLLNRYCVKRVLGICL